MMCFPGQCQPIVNANTLAIVTYANFFFYRDRGLGTERLGLASQSGMRDRIVELRPRRLLQAQPDQRTADAAMRHEEFNRGF
jgi:hypothetical protein